MRLICEFTVSDTYTYWATTTLPIIHDSAESALVEIDGILNKELSRQQAQEKLLAPLQEQSLELIRQLQKMNPNNKKHSETLEQVKNIQQKMSEINTQISDEFTFGGQKFYYSNFIQREFNEGEQPHTVIVLPTVYTLDEFFKPVET